MSRGHVHILDDNAEFRASTGFLLEAMDYAVHSYGSPEEALPILLDKGRDKPSCLLLDIRMPQMSGLDVHDALSEAGSDLPIVYMTGHGDVPLAVSAMGKGALTFLQKPLDTSVLEEVLEKALSPGIQRLRGARADKAQIEHTRKQLAQLTEREQQIVDGMVADMTNAQMADTYHLAIKTVELYRSRAMKKLGARNAVQLVRLVMSCDGH